jgi:steroid 5-alpha reductase family enzyme
MIPLLTQLLLITLGYATLWFIISRILKRNDIADIAWGIGYILLGTYIFLTHPTSVHFHLIYGLIIAWGIRLSVHIFIRNKGKKEDVRYENMRKNWGKYVHLFSFLQVYVLQGVLMIAIASPLLFTALATPQPISPLVYIGILVWMIGFFFESVGDYQLAQFIKNPNNRGAILSRGLWKYTRHPNYFGEVTMWWGIFLISLSAGVGFWALVSPLTITILILGVSGIPMLEKKYQGNAAFDAYKQKTSAFFPLPPKS